VDYYGFARMRTFVSLVVFLLALVIATIGCAWSWETLIKNRLYNCTDDLPLDYFQPGHWVHQPVGVSHVSVPRSMSEPDTIKNGWTMQRLWFLWCFCISGSVVFSLSLAWLPWTMDRNRPVQLPRLPTPSR